MLTGKDFHIFNTTAASEVHHMTLTPWENLDSEVQRYCERVAELINTHFTTASAPQPAPCVNILADVANLPQDAQARLYQFLYNAGHRIYK